MNKSYKTNLLELDYTPSLANDFFAPIANLAWSMLLRSASDNHPDSRYDILVAQPIATITTTNDSTIIKTGSSVKVSDEDPFSLIEHSLKTLLPIIDNHTNLPFIGGALGYFGYDLGRHVEILPSLAKKDIDAPDMAIGLYKWALIVDHQECSAFIVGQNPQQHLDWLNKQKKTSIRQFKLTSNWQSNMSKKSYEDKFNRVKKYLFAGDCYQINLAQRFCANYQGEPWQAYLKLERSNSAPFSAFIQLENHSILSVSPERFLRIKERNIEAKPIKGTRPRSDNPAQDMANANDLVNTEKDQAENLMIVDLLRNDIGRVAVPGTVNVPMLFEIESFPAVHHLVSTVTAKLEHNFSEIDCLRACFPGGSITGAPKVRAMEIIEELEPHRRSIYCGSIGYLSRCGQMDTNIAIRTLVATKQMIYAWAGGGLVADSTADSEYQETLDKLGRILPILRS